MRRVAGAFVATLFALSLSACGSSASAPLPRGHQGTLAQVPWNAVGPRWSLAIWVPETGTGEYGPTWRRAELFLVNPVGGRYLLGSYESESLSLSDWSPSTERAIIDVTPITHCTGNCPYLPAHLETLDLRTGAVLESWTISENSDLETDTARFVHDHSSDVLIDNILNNAPYVQLQRLNAAGHGVLAYPNEFRTLGGYDGSFLQFAHSTNVVMAATGGVAVVNPRGQVTATWPTPKLSSCTLRRWWTSSDVLMYCVPAGNSKTALVTLDVTTGALSMLARPPVAESNEGELNAWQLTSGVYTQSAGPCGYEFLSKLGRFQLTTPVTVPGVNNADSIFVVGATSDQLLLQATAACGTGQSLAWFTPSPPATTVVLGAPLTTGSVQGALAYQR